MALGQDLYDSALHVDQQVMSVLHRQLLWGWEPLEPAQLVFYKPSCKVVIYWWLRSLWGWQRCKRKTSVLSFTISLRTREYNHHTHWNHRKAVSRHASWRLFVYFDYTTGVRTWNALCFPLTRELRLPPASPPHGAASGSVLLLECNRSSLGETTFSSLC